MPTKTRRFILTALAAAVVSAPVHALQKYDILGAGYYDGPSVAGTFGLGNIFEKVPLGAEVELGYSWTRKGDAILASQVFINQAQVGQNDTQSSGGVLDLSLNATYPLSQSYGPFKFF